MKEEVTIFHENSGFDWRNYLPETRGSFEDYGDITLLAICIWGEARSVDLRAQIAVGWTVRNRALNPRWWGRTWREVILKPYQFSAFNEGDPNREKMKDPLREDKDGRAWRQCLWVAWGIYHDLVGDITGGATHYHQSDMRNYPSWAGALRRTAEIGPFIFYTALPEEREMEDEP
jgi:spore germination cell wall hydrolase CwlJ-like protein